MEQEKDKLYTKIENINKEIGVLQVGFARIEILLSESYLRRIEILEKKQENYEEEQKARNRWIWSLILPLVIKQLYDLIVTVG